MKRITITIDDEIYTSLVDYAAQTCKEDLTRLSVSRAIRKLLANRLEELNYLPESHENYDAAAKKATPQQLPPRQILATHGKK
jgi:predicted CopG family antitoxin